MGEVSDLNELYDLSVWKVTRERLREMIAERSSGGTLLKSDVAWLVEHSGWSRAQIFKEAKADRMAPAEFGPEATFLDRIRKLGAEGFEFDDLALGLLAAHLGNMTTFRNDVLAYAEANEPDLAMPSLSTLSRKLRDTVSAQVRDGVRRGHKNRYKTTLRMRWEPEYFNQYCQLDEVILDLACLAPADTHESGFVDANGNLVEPVHVAVGDRQRYMVPIRPRLLLLQESKSRMIVAWALLSRPPTSADTCALLADAFEVRRAENGADGLIGGAFDTLVSDQAGCFRSQVVGHAMADAGGVLDINVGFSPIGKAKEERVGGTIQREVITGRVGLLSGMESVSGRDMLGTAAHKLLPFDMIVEAVRRAVYRYNYEHIHSTLATTPYEAFAEGCPNPKAVPDEVIASLMLPGPRKGVRKVLHDGIQCFNRRGFLAPELGRPDIFGTTVEIRVFHHREDRVAVFQPEPRRVDPTASDFVALATDFSHYDERQRKATMRLWQEGMATINDAAATASRLRELGAAIGDGIDINLTAAAVAEANRAHDNPEAPTEPETEPEGTLVDPRRRRATTSRPKPGPPEERSPAAPDLHESSELDAIEAALTNSLNKPNQPTHTTNNTDRNTQ